ncbi:hypothetical protein DFJ73DRAFT_758447 [Zopfochytrium polystomum]|nr:hypothetical protein DFJ73DRAFT_758447 [Zopfochytrium polystomum]
MEAALSWTAPGLAAGARQFSVRYTLVDVEMGETRALGSAELTWTSGGGQGDEGTTDCCAEAEPKEVHCESCWWQRHGVVDQRHVGAVFCGCGLGEGVRQIVRRAFLGGITILCFLFVVDVKPAHPFVWSGRRSGSVEARFLSTSPTSPRSASSSFRLKGQEPTGTHPDFGHHNSANTSAAAAAASAMSALGRVISAAAGGGPGGGATKNHAFPNNECVRIKVATSKRSMVIIIRSDATVSEFLDAVSSKIIRGFPVGSVVFNPQPVVAAMTRDGYFFDDDDLVKHAFNQDQEVITLTHEELRATLKTQLDPFFSRPVVSEFQQPRRMVTLPVLPGQGLITSPPGVPLLLGPPSSRRSSATFFSSGGMGVDTDKTAGYNGVSGFDIEGRRVASPSDENAPGFPLYGAHGKRLSAASSLTGMQALEEEGPDDVFPDDQMVDSETIFTSSIASLVSGGLSAAAVAGAGDSSTSTAGSVSGAGDPWDGGSVVSGGHAQHLIFLSFARENSPRTAENGKPVGVCDPFWIYSNLKEAGFNVFIDASDREAATHFVTCISKEYAESPLCDHEFKFSRFKKRVVCLVGAENNTDFFQSTAVGYMMGGGDVYSIDFTRQSALQTSLEQLKLYLSASSSKDGSSTPFLPSPEAAIFKSLISPTDASLPPPLPPLIPRRGRIYISYSWENSLSIVRARDQQPAGGQGTGVCDPRAVARRLRSAGFEVWIDVHRAPDADAAPSPTPSSLLIGQHPPETPTTPTPGAVALASAAAAAAAAAAATGPESPLPRAPTLINGLDLSTARLAHILLTAPALLTETDALTLGLDRSDCVLAFISDEYVESQRLVREFHFAHNVLRVPLIPIVVGAGVGALWRSGKVGEAVSKYLSIDATTSDLVGRNLEKLLRTLFKVVASSPPPEGPRREDDGDVDGPPPGFGADDDDDEDDGSVGVPPAPREEQDLPEVPNDHDTEEEEDNELRRPAPNPANGAPPGEAEKPDQNTSSQAPPAVPKK